MRSLLVLAFLLASSSITIADTVVFCNASDFTCQNPGDLNIAPTMTIQIGTDTLRFVSPVPTDITSLDPASQNGIFGNGGGSVLLQDASGNVLAEGTFLPGIFSEIHGSGFYNFFGRVDYFHLNSAIYGRSTGSGLIDRASHSNQDVQPQFSFDTFDLIIPTPPTVATPEPSN